MAVRAQTMGRPKSDAKRIEPTAAEERIQVINLKGSQAYMKWLDDLHKKTHIPKASIVRLAVAEWAVRNGHEPPPDI